MDTLKIIKRPCCKTVLDGAGGYMKARFRPDLRLAS